jgi:hypothetical protein
MIEAGPHSERHARAREAAAFSTPQLLDDVTAVSTPLQAHSWPAPAGQRENCDLVRHHEARQQPDPKPSEEVAARHEKLIALAGGADGGQKRPDLVGRQPDAVIVHADHGSAGRNLVDLEDDRLPHPGCGQSIDRILEQLTDEHLGAAVKMVRQQVDDSAKIDLKRARHPQRLDVRHPPRPEVSTTRVRAVEAQTGHLTKLP